MGSTIETERPLKELSFEVPLNEAFSIPGASGTFSVTPSLSLSGEAIVGAVTSAFTGTNAFDFQSKANFGVKKGGGLFQAGAIVSFDLGELVALAGPEPGLVEVGLQGHIGFGAKVSRSGSFQFDPHGFSIDDGLSSLRDMIAGYTIDDTELSLGLGFGSQFAWGVGTTGLYSTAEVSVVGDITNFSDLNGVAINLDVNFNYGFFVGSVDVNFNQSVPVKPVVDFILNKVPFGGLIGVSGKAALPSSTIRSVVTETLFGYEIASYSVITNPDGSLSVAGGYGAQLAALDLASVGQTVYGQYGNGFGFGGLTATSPGVGVDSSGGYHYSPRATLSLIDQVFGTDFAGAPPLGSNRGPDYSPPAPNAVDRALADLHDLIQTRLGLRDRTNDPGGSVGDSNLGAPPGTDRGESDRSGNQSGRQSGREGGGRESGGREGNSNLPIILDLDGNGIEITELSRSTVFIDGTDDGLSNRTAWAAAGDGVLFYDPDNTNQITEKRQYVFTEWDPTAASDIDALRSVFDSNGDGVLDASDAAFAQFKVMVTSADGSRTAQTLSALGIAAIDLTADATNIELPDGSVITGQTTFTKTDGSTGLVADTILSQDPSSYRVVQTSSTDGSGTRTEVSTGYLADGMVAFVYTSVVSSTGANITNSYDDDGDGVVDRIQTIVTTQAGANTVETVTNLRGAVQASAVLENRTVTTTNSDGSIVTIDRDSLGGGWFDQTEVRTMHVDGSRTIVVSDKGQNGTVYMSVTETVSANGLSRTEQIDRDGNGIADDIINHLIVVNPDGSRSETITIRNPDNSVRSSVVETVSADGRTKSVARDRDGDGLLDTSESYAITVNADGSTASTLSVFNRDGSLRSTTMEDQSPDALTKTMVSDIDGDGDTDLTRIDHTTINADGSRDTLITETNGDGSNRLMERITLGADKISSETWRDLNQDGTFQSTDLVRSVVVDPASQNRVETTYSRNPDGTLFALSTTTTSKNGLTSTTTIDADGDGDIDRSINDVTVVNPNGSTTRTLSVHAQDNSLLSSSVLDSSADGLTTDLAEDRDGDGVVDRNVSEVLVRNGDGSTTNTVSTFAGDGLTLYNRVKTEESADRRTVTVSTDSEGNGFYDRVVTTVEAPDGQKTVSVVDYEPTVAWFAQPSGVLLQVLTGQSATNQNVTLTSADGLTVTSTQDYNGDGLTDVTTVAVTTLPENGGTVTTTSLTNGDGSKRSEEILTVRDDGLATELQIDADGDNVFERVDTTLTTLNADGSETTVRETFSPNSTVLLGRTELTVSDDGLITVERVDSDGNNIFDLTTTTTVVLNNDGGTQTTTTVYDEVLATLRSTTTVSVSDDGRVRSTERDVNGDGVVDERLTTVLGDDGLLTETVSQFASNGLLQSCTKSETSSDGLSTSQYRDLDGDGAFETAEIVSRFINTDASITQRTEVRSLDGTIHSVDVETVSFDGLNSTVTADLQNDQTVDYTTTTTTALNADGAEIQTTETRSANGSLIYKAEYTEKSTVLPPSSSTNPIFQSFFETTELIDLDGDGSYDRRVHTRESDDWTEFYVTPASNPNAYWQSISSTKNGLSDSVYMHLNDVGGFWTQSDTTTFAADGQSTKTAQHQVGPDIFYTETIKTSDDGLTVVRTLNNIVSNWSANRQETTSVTTFELDGDTVLTSTTTDGAQNPTTLSISEIRTSGNGLSRTVELDLNAAGTKEVIWSDVTSANGGNTNTYSLYATTGGRLYEEVTTVSADNRDSALTVDEDGDGVVDRSIIIRVDLNRDITVANRDVSAGGAISAEVTSFTSANGLFARTDYDLDGDGTIDYFRQTDTKFDHTGATITTVREVWGTLLTYEATTTSAANGLSSTTDIDHDGDGLVDRAISVFETINADGSRTRVEEARYADGTLHSRDTTTEQGSDVTTVLRFGEASATGIDIQWSTAPSGRVSTTETAFLAGVQGFTRITEVSQDGNETFVTRAGVRDTAYLSPVGDGSLNWHNAQSVYAPGGRVYVSQTVDGAGIKTWQMRREEGAAVTTSKVKLDAAGEARLLEEAARIYDTLFDRDMKAPEVYTLVEHTTDGQLDQLGLIGTVLASSEFTTRYGSLTDAEFLTQIYLNALNRAPTLFELHAELSALNMGTTTRAVVALDLSDSVEHIAKGNGHRLTNNFEIENNGVRFERSLERDYVEKTVKALFEVALAQAPTSGQLSTFANQLTAGSTDLESVAQSIVQIGQGSGNLSHLANLSGQALVDQAFQNAFGRAPTNAEQIAWMANLGGSLISQAQFVASLAQTGEFSGAIGAGNDTYVYRSEYGSTTLAPTGTEQHGSGTNDRVIFADLSLSDLTFSQSGTELRVDWSKNGQSNYVLVGDNGQYIERFEFADGSVLGSIALNWGATLLYGTTGNDTIKGGPGREFVYGSLGDDRLEAGANNTALNQLLFGQQGNDTYVYHTEGGQVSIALSGTERADWGDDDRIVFSDLSLSDLTFSQSGTELRVDWSKNGQSNYVLVGDNGQYIERFEFADGASLSRIHEPNTPGLFRLTGTPDDDRIHSNGTVSEIAGGDGNDDIKGAAILQGGLGDDTYRVSRDGSTAFIYGDSAGADTVVFEDLSVADVTFSVGGTPSGWLGERLNVSWTATNGQAKNIAIENKANFIERFEFADGTILNALEVGGSGTDTLTGGDLDDLLVGLEGADELNGGLGNDVIRPGSGNDTAYGGAGSNDTVSYEDISITPTLALRVSLAEQGTVQETQIAGNDLLSGFENVTGSSGVDNLFGDSSDNILSGLSGSDALTGDGGNDTLFGGAGADILVGGAGADVLYGGDEAPNLDRASWRTEAQDLFFDFTSNFDQQGNLTSDVIKEDTFYGIEGWEGARSNFNTFDATDQTESFNFFGGEGGNVMYGGDGGDGEGAGLGDGLTGFDGNDTIFGNEGGDVIWGRGGDDVLDAGRTVDGTATDADADQFNFEQQSGNDTVANFEVGLDFVIINRANLDDTTSGAANDGVFDRADLQFSTVNVGGDGAIADTQMVFTASGGTFTSTITFLDVDVTDLQTNGAFYFF